MAPIRVHRPQWWLLIPLGWMLVGIVGHWLVAPVVILTLLLGCGVLRFGGGDTLERREARRQACEARRARWQEACDVEVQRNPMPRVDLTKHVPLDLPGLASSARIPADVRERAQRLDRECVSVLGYLREHGAPAAQVFEVEQIQTDFGPQALRSYLALAPGTEDSDIVLDGRTGHQLIVEQLDLLLAQVDAHLHRAARLGTDELLANHRFLTEKFGHRGDSDLTI